MSGALSGRAALLVGGAGDIGTAIARRFAAEGATVTVVDLEEPRERKPAVRALRRDALDIDGIESILDELDGPPDVFVYLIGWIAIRKALEVPVAEFTRTLDVNLTGQFAWAKAVAPRMAAGGGGSIVLMSSILGYGGTPGRVAYNASRGACMQLTRALAVEWAPLNIRVNALAPSWIDTAILRATGLDVEPLRRRSPFGRLGEPEDVAGPALFLASDDSRWISGVTLPVDGAVTAFMGAGDPTMWELE